MQSRPLDIAIIQQPDQVSIVQEDEQPVETLIERVAFDGDQDLVNNFVCSVCQDLLKDPKECSKCRNVFCRECIDKW